MQLWPHKTVWLYTLMHIECALNEKIMSEEILNLRFWATWILGSEMRMFRQLFRSKSHHQAATCSSFEAVHHSTFKPLSNKKKLKSSEKKFVKFSAECALIMNGKYTLRGLRSQSALNSSRQSDHEKWFYLWSRQTAPKIRQKNFKQLSGSYRSWLLKVLKVHSLKRKVDLIRHFFVFL